MADALLEDKDIRRLEDRIEAFSRESQLRLETVLTRIDGKLDTMSATIGGRIGTLEARIDNLSASVDAKIENLSASVDGKITNLSASVDARIEHQSVSMDGRLAAQAATMEAIQHGVAAGRTWTQITLGVVVTLFALTFALMIGLAQVWIGGVQAGLAVRPADIAAQTQAQNPRH